MKEEMTVKEIFEAFDLDCGDHSCYFAKDHSGQRTNGGCRCFDELRQWPTKIKWLILMLKARAEYLEKKR